MRSLLYKTYVGSYRVVAVIVLYGMLFGIAAYGFLMGFYAINTSWIAPTILSAMDERGLAMSEQLLASRGTLDALRIDADRLQRSLNEMKRHKAALQALEPEVKKAISREIQENKDIGQDLSVLDEQKKKDNARTRSVLGKVKEVESRIQKELAAGLITKGDAAVQLAQLNQIKTSYTDSRIAEVALRDSVLQRGTTTTQTLDTLGKRVELESQIAQLDINIAISENQLQTEKEESDRLRKAIGTASGAAYFSPVMAGGDQAFAFVPYDNKDSVSIGAPVYDCYLNFIACRHVGKVVAIAPGEEKTQNPIFKTEMRGFLVQLQLNNPESAKSKTLFLNHKPLLF